MKDPYLYENSVVLQNKFAIKEQEKLDSMEKNISFAAMSTVDKLLQNDAVVNYEYLKEIHKHLLGKLFEWAGKERIVDINKSERVLSGQTVDYCKHMNIGVEAKKIIEKLDGVKWNQGKIDEQVELFSKGITALWKVHPFREGNTRSVMTFAAHYALSKGFSINRELLADNSQYVRDSMAIATVGTEYTDNIKKIIKDAIFSGDKSYFKKQIYRVGHEPTELLIQDMRDINKFYGKNVGIKEIHDQYKIRNTLPEEERKMIEKVGNDFKEKEMQHKQEKLGQNMELDR